MGIGSYLSKYITKNLLSYFIRVELLVGLVGGSSAAILFLLFEHITSFRVLLYFIVVITGTLVGLEIPLLMRLLKDKFEFKELVSKVFTIDYIGALFASLIFPLVLVPHVGLIRSAFLFGILNVSVGIWGLYAFKEEIAWKKTLKTSAFSILFILLMGFVYSNKLLKIAETASYNNQIIFSKSSKYQRIIITKGHEDLRLYLNGNLQFSSKDEYRYHESLVHPGMESLKNHKNILVLGGGDGMAVREILKYPHVKNITLVDLDPVITDIFSKIPLLNSLNKKSLLSSKVKIINTDAFVWLKENLNKPHFKKFDFIAIDFPDPSNYSLGKLYTTTLFKLLYKALTPSGIIAIQSTSPYFARRSFWCVGNTLSSIGFKTLPYHAYVPSFGEWGYFMASKKTINIPKTFAHQHRFINEKTFENMRHFPPDMSALPTKINKLNNQILVHYFENEWSKVN